MLLIPISGMLLSIESLIPLKTMVGVRSFRARAFFAQHLNQCLSVIAL